MPKKTKNTITALQDENRKLQVRIVRLENKALKFETKALKMERAVVKLRLENEKLKADKKEREESFDKLYLAALNAESEKIEKQRAQN